MQGMCELVVVALQKFKDTGVLLVHTHCARREGLKIKV